jgi:hypothetical protein
MPKTLSELSTAQWGPTIWKLLHIAASRIGCGVDIIDTDSANAFYFVINRLNEVLPCAECKSHTKAYISSHKFDPRTLTGFELRLYIEQWLLDFHNAVRSRKGQPIIVGNVEEYHNLWRPQNFLPCDEEALTLYFNYGKTYHIIDVGKFINWNVQLKRLRLLLKM